ncbi:hypothetical protein cypCar_00036574, partial [Cyprinus carpio]
MGFTGKDIVATKIAPNQQFIVHQELQGKRFNSCKKASGRQEKSSKRQDRLPKEDSAAGREATSAELAQNGSRSEPLLSSSNEPPQSSITNPPDSSERQRLYVLIASVVFILVVLGGLFRLYIFRR